MNSDLSSYGLDDSFHGSKQNETDEFSTFSSFEVNGSFNQRKTNDLAMDRAFAGLKECLRYYEEQGHSYKQQLEQVGFSDQDLPQNIKQDLKEAFKDDDGVFVFQRASSEAVRISGDHVLNSLREKYELEQLRMLTRQMETLVEECSQMHDSLERKLYTEKEYSEKLKNKCCVKEANLLLFNKKVEDAATELRTLQQLSQGNKKPKYSSEDLEDLRQKVNQLNTEISVTTAKLRKYHNLPLNEKDAQKEVEKMKEALKNIEDEIRNKVCL